jgi:hypothetical protein
MSYRTEAPAYWSAELAGDPDSGLDEDLCVIKGEYFFVNGNIDIPIIGEDGIFSWGVWVSLSHTNFLRTMELWTTSGRELEPPYFGWLSTELPVYAPHTTVGLKTNVHTQPVGVRPTIELEPTDHRLAVEQRTGITRERVREIAQLVMHPEGA